MLFKKTSALAYCIDLQIYQRPSPRLWYVFWFLRFAIPFLKPFGIMATSRLGRDVEGIDAITSRLTQTNLAEDTTRPAIEPPTGKAEMEAITNCLSHTALKEDRIEGEEV